MRRKDLLVAQWNPQLFNRYVSPSFSDFTEAKIPEISDEYPNSVHWQSDLFLNNVFRAKWKRTHFHCVKDFLRRTMAARTAYCEARASTFKYLDQHDPTNPNLSQYYQSLNVWENCLLQIQIGLDLFKWFNQDQGAFDRLDGSPEQRIYDIANKVKHLSNDLRNGAFDDANVTPIWLTVDGIRANGALSCTFDEVSKVILDMCKLAEELKDPATFRENTLAAQSKK